MKAALFPIAVSLVSWGSAMEPQADSSKTAITPEQAPSISKPKAGISFLLRLQERMDENGSKMPITKEQVDQAVNVVGKRLKHMGTANALISREGTDGIVVQVPGIELESDEAGLIRDTLENNASLELREVHERTEDPGPDGRTLAQRVQDGAELIPGYRAYTQRVKDRDGNEDTRPILINRRLALGGSDIASALPSPQQPDAVAVMLNDDGTDKMIALTKNMRPGIDRIAIVLDGEVISAPVVNQVPLGKNFIIEGMGKPGDVQSLATALMCPLETPLKIERVSPIPPTSE